MAEIQGNGQPDGGVVAADIQKWNAEMESALREALSPVAEVIGKLDTAIGYHEGCLHELRETRKRAKRVEAALAPPEPKPKRAESPKLREVTAARHRAERVAKAERIAAFVRSNPDEEITATKVYEALSTEDAPAISRGLVYELLREAHEGGLLRLDRQGAGGQAVYRLVGAA